MEVVAGRDDGHAVRQRVVERQQFQPRIGPRAVLFVELRSEVVVGRCAPEVGLHDGPFVEQAHAVRLVAGHEAVGAAEVDACGGTFDDQVVAVVVADRERANRIVTVGPAFGDGERCGCGRT